MNPPRRTAGHNSDVGRVFAISTNNLWMHVYHDVQSMLESKDVAAAAPGAVEFFDIRGHRLAPVFSGSWTLEGLRRIAGRPNEEKVQGRLGTVIQTIRACLEQRLTESANPPGSLQEALVRLPNLDGKNLQECFGLLENDFSDGAKDGGPIGIMDDGSFWHNFWCH